MCCWLFVFCYRLFVDMDVKCILGLVVLVAVSALAEREASLSTNILFFSGCKSIEKLSFLGTLCKI